MPGSGALPRLPRAGAALLPADTITHSAGMEQVRVSDAASVGSEGRGGGWTPTMELHIRIQQRDLDSYTTGCGGFEERQALALRLA